jgi:hypothetical protein
LRPFTDRPILLPGVLLCLCIPALAAAQGPSPLQALDSAAGLRTLSRSSFEGKALYGYIDGGAEVYHEYGFRRLEVRTIVAGAETLTVEGYEMRDPFAAFGILGISRGGCLPDSSLGSFSYTSEYQSQSAIGRLYLRVMEGNGGRLNPATGRRVARLLRQSDQEGVVDLRRLFGGVVPPGDPALVVAARGTLGLQNGWDGWTDLFEGMEGFEVVLLPAEGGGVCAGAARFKSAADSEAFQTRWTKPPTNGKERSFRMKGDTLLLLEITGSDPVPTTWREWLDR